MKFIYLTFTIIGLVILGGSCNDINSTPHSLKYSTDKISVDYYTQGSSKAPKINWGNGKIGTFILDKTYTGLSINKDNGIISWTKDFFENNRSIKVIAKNSFGETYTRINITSKFNKQFNTDLKFTSPFEDVTITIEDSRKVNLCITINGKTEIIEASLSINKGKLTFSNYTIDNLINGKDIYVLKLKPLKCKSNFEGEILKSKLVNHKIKTIYNGKIYLENV